MTSPAISITRTKRCLLASATPAAEGGFSTAAASPSASVPPPTTAVCFIISAHDHVLLQDVCEAQAAHHGHANVHWCSSLPGDVQTAHVRDDFVYGWLQCHRYNQALERLSSRGYTALSIRAGLARTIGHIVSHA